MNIVRKLLGIVGTALEKPLFLLQTLKKGAAILVYHRISPEADRFYSPTPPNVFHEQLDLIGRYYTILPLDELIQRFETGRPLRGCCSITFDDGFADFLTYAYPILLELDIPAVHFVTTEGVKTGRPTWNYRLNRALHSLTLAKDFAFSPRTNKAPGWAELMRAKRLVDNLTRHEREAFLCKIEAITQPISNPTMLNANDLRSIDPSIVQWGSHTVSHTTLVGRSSEDLHYELANSRNELESILEKPVKFLAYPNGNADALAMRTAAECGYTASFLADSQRYVIPGMPIHGIPRIDVGALPVNMLGLELMGVTPLARKILNR
jgi:peptidoglycan/xylan/chitin deacetylase (PgdA/CDA1 family)